MQVIKPQTLGIGSRVIEYRKRFGLCVSGILYVPFSQGPLGTLWSEQSMWDFLGQEMKQPLIDEGVKKLTSEFLVHGYAFPNERNSAAVVRARLGNCAKTLLVSGDRYWLGTGRSSAPQPFERMPLTWERAYGGEGYAPNPVGRGRAVVDGVQWLPNLELPESRVVAPDDVVTPAGFGMLDIMHPQRSRYRGTYDDVWMKEHSPGFAPDLDWKHFNVAPSDQWLEAPMRGDEPFELAGMHPAKPLLEGALPGLAVRVIVSCRSSDRGLEQREVAMQPTTVWFFPHAERLVMVYHGLLQVTEDDASDVEQLIGGIERLGERKDAAHYADVIARRGGPTGAMHALNDSDLLPVRLDTADPESDRKHAAMRSEGLREQAAYRRAQIDVGLARQALRAQGKDPDALGVKLQPRETPPTAAELPAYLERLQKQMEEQKWAAIADAVTHVEKAVAFAQRAGNPAAMVHRGPPRFRAVVQLDEIAAGFARAGAAFDRGALAKQLKQQEFSLHVDYLRNAHMQPPAPALTGEAAAGARKEVEWLLSRGVRAWPAIDLTGADLSKLDLRGADLTGAWLESANLSGANLSGANLTAAVLAHANLSGATAIGANFHGANLGRSELTGAIFDDANFKEAILRYARLGRTRFHRASLDRCELSDAHWGEADWRGVVAEGLLFYKLDLRGVTFEHARLTASNFIDCDVSGVRFTQAELASANFVSCKAEGAHFAGAALPRATFVQGTTLTKADFRQANLAAANLAEIKLDGARFGRAILDGANLGLASLVGCDARLASAKGALLRRAVLAGARLAAADFKDAILQHADLRGADLRQANLFGADLARVRVDRETRLDGALLERARTYPRLRRDEQAAGDEEGRA